MEPMTRTEILRQALDHRDQELLGYQINIDNYRLAIENIKAEYHGNEDLQVFREELQQRLDEERRQQLRSRVIRDVIAQQLSGLSTGTDS